MNELLKMIFSYFGLALMAAGTQNAVFTRALGISSGLRIISDRSCFFVWDIEDVSSKVSI